MDKNKCPVCGGGKDYRAKICKSCAGSGGDRTIRCFNCKIKLKRTESEQALFVEKNRRIKIYLCPFCESQAK